MKRTPYLVLLGLLVLGVAAFVLSDSGLLEGRWKKVASVDTDKDGLVDEFEMDIGTDPNSADTDGAGKPDGTELKDKTDPLDPLDDGTMQPLKDDESANMDDAQVDQPKDDMDDAQVDQPKDDSNEFDDIKVTR